MLNRMTRPLLSVVGIACLAVLLLSLTSAPTQAINPVPVTVVNTPLPVTGTVTANVVNTVPVSGTINATLTNPGLLPQLPSNTITLSASSLVSPGCGSNTTNTTFEQFTFNYFVVKNSGVLEPFTLPAGEVFVATSFDWVAYGSPSVASQVRVASLLPATSVGFNAADALSTALADSAGRAGGSRAFPTGIVLQNPGFFCLEMYPVVPGEVVSGTVNGFLAADR